jgi:hypothetical protein
LYLSDSATNDRDPSGHLFSAAVVAAPDVAPNVRLAPWFSIFRSPQNLNCNILMNIAILGTGMVGAALGTKLVQGGQNVMMGSRSANSEGAANGLDGSPQISWILAI